MLFRSTCRAGPPAWQVLDQADRLAGWTAPGLVASYVHLHLGAAEGLAGRLVEACSQR